MQPSILVWYNQCYNALKTNPQNYNGRFLKHPRYTLSLQNIKIEREHNPGYRQLIMKGVQYKPFAGWNPP